MSVYKGPPKKFLGQRLEKDADLDQVKVVNQFAIPRISSANLPPPYLANYGGGLAYDVITQVPWYSDGTTWKPLVSTLPPGNVQSFSFIAGANQIIVPNIDTPIIMWSILGPPPVYTTLPQWNLATGIYTATQTENLYISVNICWAANISNLGDRTLRIEYQFSGGGGWQFAAESTLQAEPKTNVETPQSCDMNLLLNVGDQVRITVEHTAPLNLQVAGGIHSTVSGFRTGV
jgi:hypothetical protein